MNVTSDDFDHSPHTRIVFGNGCAERIGELTAQIGGKRVLVVTDSGIVSAGHAGLIESSLNRAGLSVAIYTGVRENPTTRDVDVCVAAAREHATDLIIGLGGGSSMDTAKGCNFILSNGGRMQDYWGIGKAAKPMLPLIAVPTTAGTGSECQSFALIADDVTHQKMACGDPKAAPRIALLDPSLTLTQPPHVTACTGIDAVAHAVESYVCTKATALSRMYAAEAFRLTHTSLEHVLTAPNNLDARGRMLLGAAFAGCAIENSMLGAAHSAANPLTARLNIVHGKAVGIMLPYIVRFNAQTDGVEQLYTSLAVAGGIAHPGSDTLARRVEYLLKIAAFSAIRIPDDALDALSAEAAKQWTATFNPRPMVESDFRTIYQQACES